MGMSADTGAVLRRVQSGPRPPGAVGHTGDEGGSVKAVVYEGPRQVSVKDVPDARIERPTDVLVRITSANICGSDLHMYEGRTDFEPGRWFGHENLGQVVEVGDGVDKVQVGEYVVLPFNISCGHCWMCEHQLYSQCETTQNREAGMGASLFGYTKLYGQVPGGQAEYLRVPQAQFGPIKVPDGPPDDRFV
jgi:threonine dehydrogenase-like Zn-dependent dehydrogenase